MRRERPWFNISGANAHTNVRKGTFPTDCESDCIRIVLRNEPEHELTVYKEYAKSAEYMEHCTNGEHSLHTERTQRTAYVHAGNITDNAQQSTHHEQYKSSESTEHTHLISVLFRLYPPQVEVSIIGCHCASGMQRMGLVAPRLDSCKAQLPTGIRWRVCPARWGTLSKVELY